MENSESFVGDVHEEIKSVSADKWDTLQIDELIAQKNILFDRLATAIQMNKPEIVQFIQQGIDKIEVVIKSKIGVGTQTI